jgi:hypothetical protein
MMAMATSTAFGTNVSASTQPAQTVSAQTATVMADASQAQVSTPASSVQGGSASPTEPPPITSMNLDSLTITPKNENKPKEPVPFTSKEMQDLNKALEELSKAPLSTESVQPTTQQQ